MKNIYPAASNTPIITVQAGMINHELMTPYARIPSATPTISILITSKSFYVIDQPLLLGLQGVELLDRPTHTVYLIHHLQYRMRNLAPQHFDHQIQQ